MEKPSVSFSGPLPSPLGFSGDACRGKPACQCRRQIRRGLIPGSGRALKEAWHFTPVFSAENPIPRNLAGYGPELQRVECY